VKNLKDTLKDTDGIATASHRVNYRTSRGKLSRPDGIVYYTSHGASIPSQLDSKRRVSRDRQGKLMQPRLKPWAKYAAGKASGLVLKF